MKVVVNCTGMVGTNGKTKRMQRWLLILPQLPYVSGCRSAGAIALTAYYVGGDSLCSALTVLAGCRVSKILDVFMTAEKMHCGHQISGTNVGPNRILILALAQTPIGWWDSLSLVSGAKRESVRDSRHALLSALCHR